MKRIAARIIRLGMNAAIAALTLFILVPHLYATCFLPQPRLARAEYFHSDAVVEARLTKIRLINPTPNSFDARVYTLQLLRAFRGRITPAFEVYEENGRGRASFDWIRGRSYLLFLFPAHSFGFWALDGCGNSNMLERSKTALTVIQSISSSQNKGVIEGEINYSNVGQSTTLPAQIQVTVTQSGKTFSTRIISTSKFRIQLPPGVYSLRLSAPGFSFEKDQLSYEDPRNLNILRGSCIQIEMDAITNSAPSSQGR